MELQEVCESLLDNAEMRINLSAYPKVTMDLLSQGKVNDKFWKVVFECDQVVCLDLQCDDDSSTNDLFVVLEASVKKRVKMKVAASVQDRLVGLNNEDPVWEIYLYGSVLLTMFTTKFKWQLIELSEKDYLAAHT